MWCDDTYLNISSLFRGNGNIVGTNGGRFNGFVPLAPKIIAARTSASTKNECQWVWKKKRKKCESEFHSCVLCVSMFVIMISFVSVLAVMRHSQNAEEKKKQRSTFCGTKESKIRKKKIEQKKKSKEKWPCSFRSRLFAILSLDGRRFDEQQHTRPHAHILIRTRVRNMRSSFIEFPFVLLCTMKVFRLSTVFIGFCCLSIFFLFSTSLSFGRYCTHTSCDGCCFSCCSFSFFIVSIAHGQWRNKKNDKKLSSFCVC